METVAQGQAVTRLSALAFIFIPLSFVAVGVHCSLADLDLLLNRPFSVLPPSQQTQNGTQLWLFPYSYARFFLP
jgi:hypothetical protein